ncbi:MAG: hypothetical protein ABEJ61_08085 [Haloferacaceae archaeon]
MFGIESLAGKAHAAATIGLVLLEAAALYVGYGAVERVVSEHVVGLVEGT